MPATDRGSNRALSMCAGYALEVEDLRRSRQLGPDPTSALAGGEPSTALLLRVRARTNHVRTRRARSQMSRVGDSMRVDRVQVRRAPTHYAAASFTFLLSPAP